MNFKSPLIKNLVIKNQVVTITVNLTPIGLAQKYLLIAESIDLYQYQLQQTIGLVLVETSHLHVS